MIRAFAAYSHVARLLNTLEYSTIAFCGSVCFVLLLVQSSVQAQMAVSSDEFLKQFQSSSVRSELTHAYPLGPMPSPSPQTLPIASVAHTTKIAPYPSHILHPVQASYLEQNSNSAGTIDSNVASAQYETWQHTQPSLEQQQQQQQHDQPSTSNDTVGSGLATEGMPRAVTNTPLKSASEFPSSSPDSRYWTSWSEWFTLDPSRPDFYLGLEVLSLRRGNDTGGSVSDGGGFDRTGREVAGRYTLGKLNSGLDRTEWVFLGPFEWERNSRILGPVSTSIGHGNAPASSLGAITNADRHDQSQTSSMASLEWNRSWSSDGLSSFLGGFRLWDYDERYRLNGNQGATVGEFTTSTDNILVGSQVGISLMRPLSQRLSVGAGTLLGVFGNFAKASYQLSSDGIAISGQRDDAFRLLWTAQPNAIARYQVSQNAWVSCGYEAFYFSKMATVSDLRLGNVANGDSFSLRARDDQLLYGFSACLSGKF